MASEKTYHILNLGAGVQSTALYLMSLDGEFDERIDYAVFADTQEEPQSILIDTGGKLGDDLIHGMNKHGSAVRLDPGVHRRRAGQAGRDAQPSVHCRVQDQPRRAGHPPPGG